MCSKKQMGSFNGLFYSPPFTSTIAPRTRMATSETRKVTFLDRAARLRPRPERFPASLLTPGVPVRK